jgi:urease accessory protein
VALAIAPKEHSDVFAANRARGRIALTVAGMGGVTRRARVYENGSLRVRFPGGAAEELEAVVINTAGGIAGGDRFRIDVAVGAGARLAITSAAAEKVYRSLGEPASISLKLKVAAGGALAWLPQETILFDQARLARSIDVDVAEDGRAVIAEALVFGRAGMGETVERGSLFDRWRVRCGGQLVYAETLRLDGAIRARLAEPAIANGGVAVATLLMVPGDDAMVEAVRALSDGFRSEVGASAWNGIAAVRLCAADGMALRHDLTRILATIRGAPLPRLWLN